MEVTWQREATIIMLLVGLGLYVAWDLYVACFATRATISEITIAFLYRFPAVSLVLGGIMGHLTWPVESTRPHVQTVALVAATLIVAILVSVFRLVPPTMPVVGLLLGTVWGHIIWPQKIATETGADAAQGAPSLADRVFPTHIESRTTSTDLRAP